ncbi:hypothetical protein [Parabacteroides sp.]
MRKEFMKGVAGAGLLVLLPACGVLHQPGGGEPLGQKEVSTLVDKGREESAGPIFRQVDVPLLQVDAQSVYSRMVTYITPEEELAPVMLNERLSAYIDFPANGVSLNPKYGNNRAELSKLEERLIPLLLSGNVKGIRITGYASPDGNTKENERLAGNRAIQFKSYLQKQFKQIDPSLITIDWVGEDWAGLQRLISESQKPYSARVEAIFQLTNDPESRRKQIKAMDKGAVYKDIEKSFFSRLRRMELTVEVESVPEMVDTPHLIELVYTQPDKLSLPEILRVASLFRSGTEQYREIYEIAAYTYPSSAIAQLNAAAASLALGDRESARYFFQQVDADSRAYNNLGVLSLMDGDKEAAAAYFRKSFPQNPRQARENLKLMESADLKSY